MITNEAEIRIALQAVLVSVLALYGFWGCALLVFIILLPWKPIFAVGGYLAQPVVDWRMQKARDRHDTESRRLSRNWMPSYGPQGERRAPPHQAAASPSRQPPRSPPIHHRPGPWNPSNRNSLPGLPSRT